MKWSSIHSTKKLMVIAIVILTISVVKLGAYSQSNTSKIYLPLICSGDCSSGIQQPDKTALINSISLITNTLPIPEGYEPFQVGNDNNIEIKGDWALFNLMSVPTKEKQDEYGTAPDILLGVAHKENGEWKVYIESTPNYLNILSSLPDWLQWLAKRSTLVYAAGNSNTISVPGLPFSPGHAWRYTQGPNSSHQPFESVDFATWPHDTASMVHAVDRGIVVAIGNNHGHENCITIERQDGAKIFYLHLNDDQVRQWHLGNAVNVGYPLAQTEIDTGCLGTVNSHHVHIEFRTQTNPYADPKNGWYKMMGSSFNGWTIGGQEVFRKSWLDKDGFRIYEDTGTYSDSAPLQDQMKNRAAHSAYDCNPFNFSLYGVAIFQGSTCDGNYRGFTDSGKAILDNEFDDKANSVFVHPGWHVILSESKLPQGEATCIYGSVTNLSNYRYPNSVTRLSNSISAIEVSNQGICPQEFSPPVYVNPACSQLVAGASIYKPACLPELTPVPATPIPDGSIPTVVPIPGLPADSWYVDYFDNLNLGGGACNSQTVTLFDNPSQRTFVFKDWGENAPYEGCHREFSARIWRQIHLEAGTYNFHLFADDHARFELQHAPGGDLIIDQWNDTQHNESRSLPAGDYEFVIIYQDTGGAAWANFWWDGPGYPAPPHENKDPNQWFSAFWQGTEWHGDAFMAYNDGNPLPLDKEWGSSGPGYGLPNDNFSSKYERTYNFACGDYRFYLEGDDYAELRVLDPNTNVLQFEPLVVTAPNPGVQSPSLVHLTEKKYVVSVIHKEYTGDARLFVDWEMVTSCPTPTPLSTPTGTATNTSVPSTPTNVPSSTPTPTVTSTPTNTPVAQRCDQISQISKMECKALEAFYNSTDQVGETDNWFTTNTPCTSWVGVECSGGHVTALRLDDFYIHGTIPPELGNLTQLQVLDLADNFALTGSIPSTLGNLTQLKTLHLDRNALSGTVPPELGNLANLQELTLYTNQLSGSLPANFTNLLQLKLLYFDDTNLCEPGESSFQTWLGRIPDLQRTNAVCGVPVNTFQLNVGFQARNNLAGLPQNVPVKVKIKDPTGSQVLVETGWLSVTPAPNDNDWGTTSVDVVGVGLLPGQPYQIFVTGAMHLSRRTITQLYDGAIVNFTQWDPNGANILHACDINQDNQVTQADVDIWLSYSHVGGSPPAQPDPFSEIYRTDQNGDRVIDIDDFGICKYNLGLLGD